MNHLQKTVTLTIFAFLLLSVFWPAQAGPSQHSRQKRDTFDMLLKKKGFSAAATALIAASSITKKKFLPIPIPFPLPIMKPPIIEPIPFPFMGHFGMGMGHFGGMGGYGR